MLDWLTAIFVGIVAILAFVVGFRPQLTRSREGKILAFLALMILPVLSGWGAFTEHMERATSTQFCLSCHVMAGFGQSLNIDDKSYIPAVHYQNNRIPRDQACYTCHTDYSMFGTLKAKLKGIRHLQVQYFGTVPKPGDIKLYTPYNNRECLHCHLGARSFETAAKHLKNEDTLSRIKSGQLSCVSSHCHDSIHDVGSLNDQKFWKGGN